MNSNEYTIHIPNEYQKMNSMPDDPKNSNAYGKQTPSLNCFITMYPISKEKAMPFDNERVVINGIHSALGDTQGLIEVKAGNTKNNKKYIYSIVKTKLEPSGIQYILTMHIDMNDYVMNLQSFFDEVGITGQREAVIMNQLLNEGKILSNMDGWMQDPYDENLKKGLLMNISGKKEYDTIFQNHPLTEERKLIHYIIENN